jgi:hypothetical protein
MQFCILLGTVKLFLSKIAQAVQTGLNFVNGEERLNLAPSHVNPDPLLMPFSNELDIFASQNTKRKNLEHGLY